MPERMPERGRGKEQGRGRARRAAIVEAAVTLFATKGYRGTSIAAVAELAGLTDAGVLYHFRTKASLLLAVLQHHDEHYGEMVLESRAGGPAAEFERLREWGTVMERDTDLTALFVTLSAEHLREESPTNAYFRARYQAVLQGYEDSFNAAADAGLLRREIDAHREAVALTALLDGLRLQWFFTDRSVSIADTVRWYIDALARRLAPLP
jgi:AcrR family transcriptional regulator